MRTSAHPSQHRRSQDPVLLVYAHGLGWIVINRNTVVLGGRQLALYLTAVRKKPDKAVPSAGGAWSLGLILALPEFIERNIEWARQLEVHDGEPISRRNSKLSILASPRKLRKSVCGRMTKEPLRTLLFSCNLRTRASCL